MTNDTLILCAFRYCLGRMSYIVSDMTNHLIMHWEEIHPNMKKIIKEEIKECIERDNYGMDMDKRCWMEVLNIDKSYSSSPSNTESNSHRTSPI